MRQRLVGIKIIFQKLFQFHQYILIPDPVVRKLPSIITCRKVKHELDVINDYRHTAGIKIPQLLFNFLKAVDYDIPFFFSREKSLVNIVREKIRGCLKTIVNGSEFAEGNNDSRNHEHFVGGFSRLLVISAQPSEVFKPCEGSLNDPSFPGRYKLTGII